MSSAFFDELLQRFFRGTTCPRFWGGQAPCELRQIALEK